MNFSRVRVSEVVRNEIAYVVCFLLQCVIWDAKAVPYHGKEVTEDAIWKRRLPRKRVLLVRHWEYISPFLDAIQSVRVGASITTSVLGSVWKLLTSNVITALIRAQPVHFSTSSCPSKTASSNMQQITLAKQLWFVWCKPFLLVSAQTFMFYFHKLMWSWWLCIYEAGVTLVLRMKMRWSNR